MMCGYVALYGTNQFHAFIFFLLISLRWLTDYKVSEISCIPRLKIVIKSFQ